MEPDREPLDDPRVTPTAIWGLVANVLVGEATAEEHAAVAAWAAESPRRARTIQVMRHVWGGVGESVRADTHAFARVMARVENEQSPTQPRHIVEAEGDARRTDPVKRRFRRVGHERSAFAGDRGMGRFLPRPLRRNMSFGAKPLLVTSAIITGVLGIVVFGTFWRETPPATLAHTYTTAAGQQATVTLADGSRVLLGPATTVSVFSRMSRTAARDIDLRVVGQALFTVSQSHDRVFRVQAGNAVARVLGTTFLVRRYETDTVTRVVVADGRVALSTTQNSTRIGTERVLVASTLGTVDDSGTVQVTPHVEVEDYTAWTTGQLVFRKTPARDAVSELGRAYGVEIRIADSATAVQRLTWTIPVSDRSLNDVLESLMDVLDAHPVRTGRVIMLVPGRVVPNRPIGSPSPHPSERVYGK